jgi:hypothetical protein
VAVAGRNGGKREDYGAEGEEDEEADESKREPG